ncbi:cysteine proteinase [Pluteus cervinus]|uniref:Cysteine proteinase n=1 Tax=Pluteus cervinus TaxID=181527 RepID=A0ACD3BGH1_9AGAR|nr:cysteine proteinase [Pluteus cervinus]
MCSLISNGSKASRVHQRISRVGRLSCSWSCCPLFRLVWFNYYMKVESVTKESEHFLSVSDGETPVNLIPVRTRRFSSPHQDNLASIERAIHSAKATLAVKPPQFQPIQLDKLLDRHHKKDKAIDRRLHGPKPLPTSLSREEEAWVSAFASNKESNSKFAKERVSFKDLVRLGPEQWLNDEIINFYGAMIMGRSEGAKENDRKKFLRVHYFSTFFWTKLIKEGYERGRLGKWSKKVDIFEKDIVLIPVNHGNAHWTGAAINFRFRRIESYDSMGFRHEEVYRALRDYLDAEHRNKRGRPFDFTGWEDYFLSSTPQQQNGYDCGVFTCQFLETLSRGVEEFNFTQKDMPYLRRRMIWEIGHSCLREES